jgi:hypothetical protein
MRMDWNHAYKSGKKDWKIVTGHCKHCYREGFFDAGVTGLLIIVALILTYGIEVMK